MVIYFLVDGKVKRKRAIRRVTPTYFFFSLFHKEKGERKKDKEKEEKRKKGQQPRKRTQKYKTKHRILKDLFLLACISKISYSQKEFLSLWCLLFLSKSAFRMPYKGSLRAKERGEGVEGKGEGEREESFKKKK